MHQKITEERKTFVPALRFKWATGIYDGLMHYLARDRALRNLSVAAVAPKAEEAILDIGCGTGSLSLALAKEEPGAWITGYDIDPEILEIAKAKLAMMPPRVSVAFRAVNVTEPSSLPKNDAGRFDCVTSSLLFHHLTSDQKRAALASVKALLRPYGRFVLIDWGPGANIFLKAAFWLVRLLDGLEVTRDNARGRLPEMLEEAGFLVVEEKPILNTVFGTVWLYKAAA